MHNSIHLRELLRRVNADPRRVERRDPHRLLAPDPRSGPGPGEFRLACTWRLSARVPDVAAGAALTADLADFFRHYGIASGPDAGAEVILTLDPVLSERDCRLTFAPDRLQLVGGGLAGLWAGLTWLEWEVKTRRGAFLPVGTVEHHAAWPLQISQGPWGANYSVPDFSPEYLGDDGFRLYAHYGINSMMIYGDLLCYIHSEILPELNHPEAEVHLAMLKDAAVRAARYGVRFTYVPIGAKLRADHPVFKAHPELRGAGCDSANGPLHFLCSSSPKVLAFYEETFRNLFTRVPELAGVILIVYSESFYHCRMWDKARHPCPVCESRNRHEVVAGTVAAVQRGMLQGQPEAFIAAWIYTWTQGDRRRLFAQLPRETRIFHAIEKDSRVHKDGYTKEIWDYSIDGTGPSPEILELAEFAPLFGRKLMIKTETGIGLEVFQFPYVPAMQRLAAKWAGVRELHPWGVHQSWLFFGMFGSRAEELGFWAVYGSVSRHDFLRRLATRDFGPGAADLVLAAWSQLSTAVGHLPCICLEYYYVGPSFLGPAHPLMPDKNAVIPEVFSGFLFYLQEHEETFSVRQIEDTRTCLVMKALPEKFWGTEPDEPGTEPWPIMIREYTRAAADAKAAWELLRLAGATVTQSADRERLTEETRLTELVYRTFLSCENTLRFLLARRDWEKTAAPAPLAEMWRIAALELANARAAVPIYRECPWLDLKERTDGYFRSSLEMIAAKCRGLERFLGGQGEE